MKVYICYRRLRIIKLHHSSIMPLKEVQRILKKDGQLLVFEITSDNPLVQIYRKLLTLCTK